MTDFDLAAYDFDLPDALIAQRPAERRDGSRMLVVDRAAGTITDARFADLPEYVRPGDAVVLNDTRVVPARLVGRRPTGGAAELFLAERLGAGEWAALVRPGRKLRQGATVALDAGVEAEIVRVRADGRRVVRLTRDGAPLASEADERAALDAAGQMPLPHYMKRPADAADAERYQTVVADKRGAVAAPTAGLHFTPATLDALRARGARVHTATLHVGYGTFEPVKTDDLRAHAVAPETAELDAPTAASLDAAREAGGRLLAIGTTTTRTLEAAAASGRIEPVDGPVDLTILPGYRFRAVDALLTNFHLPRSSLLVLVSAFAGRELVLEAYRHAVREGYRFYSYGDCMLIV